MKSLIFTLLLTIGLISNAFSWHSSLRYLVMESEHIMVGYVIKTFEHEQNKDSIHSYKTITQVSILERLQGNIKTDTIELGFHLYAPPKYFDDAYVLIFQYRSDTTYYCLSDTSSSPLNYQAITLSKKEIEIYKQRILEMQKILKYANKAQKFIETVEWLVKCEENKATSGAGSSELNRDMNINFMFSYVSEDFDDFGSLLTFSQKKRLKEALLGKTKLYEINLDLVDLVYQDNEKEKDIFLMERLKTVKNNPDDLWAAGDIIAKLNEKRKIKRIDSLLGKMDIFKGDNSAYKIALKCIQLLE